MLPGYLINTAEAILDISGRLTAMGVYPFVVPFRPLAGTLATDVDGVPAPDSRMVASVTARVGAALRRAGMLGAAQSAGCAACGACSALSCEGA